MGKGIIEILHCNTCGGYIVVDLKKLWSIRECPTCESRDLKVWEKTEIEDGKDNDGK